MAYSYPQTLNPSTYGGAGGDVVFDEVDSSKPYETLSRVAATSVVTPDLLRISHQDSKVSGIAVERHLVRRDKTYTDTDLGKVTLSAYMVVSVPVGTTSVTEAEILDMVGELVDFTQNSGNMLKFLNKES
jgi:hypothetical protein